MKISKIPSEIEVEEPINHHMQVNPRWTKEGFYQTSSRSTKNPISNIHNTYLVRYQATNGIPLGMGKPSQPRQQNQSINNHTAAEHTWCSPSSASVTLSSTVNSFSSLVLAGSNPILVAGFQTRKFHDTVICEGIRAPLFSCPLISSPYVQPPRCPLAGKA